MLALLFQVVCVLLGGNDVIARVRARTRSSQEAHTQVCSERVRVLSMYRVEGVYARGAARAAESRPGEKRNNAERGRKWQGWGGG
eukprot:6214422-Pleurochrysis_carterae.AAC.2